MVDIKLEIPRTLNDSNPINLTLKTGDQLPKWFRQIRVDAAICSI